MGDERLIRDTAAWLARRGKVPPRVASRKDLVAEVRRRLQGAALDPLRVQHIVEPDGRQRVLHVSRGIDRVIEAVVHHVLRRELRVFAVAPRALHDELARFISSAATLEFGARIDIAAAYDSISREHMLAVLGALLPDASAIDVVARLVERHPADVGVPTGSALSPLLLEVALVEPDAELRPRLPTLRRYADDFAIAAPDLSAAAKHVAMVGAVLAPFGFAVNPRKSGVHALEDGVPFLGHVVRRTQEGVRAYADPKTVAEFLAREHARRARELGPNPTPHRKEEYRAQRERRLAGLRSFYRLADQPSLELMLQGLASPVPET